MHVKILHLLARSGISSVWLDVGFVPSWRQEKFPPPSALEGGFVLGVRGRKSRW